MTHIALVTIIVDGDNEAISFHTDVLGFEFGSGASRETTSFRPDLAP